jgi:hypothetical protein
VKVRDVSRTILLAGSGRSGTTWLGSILAANPNVRVLFEPFDHRRVPQVAGLPLRPYARPGERYPDWEPTFRAVLQGEIQNDWVNQEGHRWWANRLLVKDIRITLALGWLSSLYNPRIVYVVRHPCAVVLSRLKLGWDTHLDAFMAQPHLIADYLEPYLDLISSADTMVKKHAIMWCVENLVPLRQRSSYGWAFVTYEELYAQPRLQAERILSYLGVRRTWFTERAIRRVSVVTRPDSAVRNGRSPLQEWQSQLSREDIRVILDTTERFGIDLYREQALPARATA